MIHVFNGNEMCVVCGGRGHSLTTECPGSGMQPDYLIDVSKGTLDFRFDRWLSIGRTRVVNIDRERYDVSIMRGTPYGNKYVIGVDGGRWECIHKFQCDFKLRVRHDEEFRRQVMLLLGLRIGCVCKPKPCHGDVIVEWLRQFERKKQRK